VTERRKFLRFEAALGALCEIVSEKSKVVSSIKNISKEGALVVIDKPLYQGSEIRLSMDVPGDNVPIFATCQVAWQRAAKDTNSDHSFETGLRFTRIDSPDRCRLLDYIYRHWFKFANKNEALLQDGVT
jgi:hypothetical protein